MTGYPFSRVQNKEICDINQNTKSNPVFTLVYRIGIACSSELPRDRIDMSYVLDQLKFVKKTFLEGSKSSSFASQKMS
ncbi:hypothetical protein OSB04_013950 [Centaurea solstitialis]|uniref:Non-specific serine/threonine protein kinase n=1 Tax=Centaurea solstitialis TaxID=347529 RepID=A0AA38TS44_9ASTR|nr:hypothetical protein OSB04_013950 [Centaurea solstitialis]